MYAIIKTGGKQYRVAKDDVIDVELLQAEDGTNIEFNDVLFVFDGNTAKIGQPNLVGWSVQGEVVGKVSGPKITSIKYKPSHNICRKFGHRQHYSRVKITALEAGKETRHGS